jgi:GNAT superfamily N-acetyltransferase
MQSYDVRLLSASDLEGAMRLSSAAGWNQRLEDWRLLVSLAPAASFAAVSEERIVATAIGIDYGRFSWIAMMLVDPDWRGRGIGRRLLNAAMEVVPADRPIRLDATPMGRPLYQSCGFEDEVLLTRHRSEAAPRASPPVAPRAQAAAEPMTHTRLRTVTGEDGRVFGGDRRAVLRWSFDDAREYCHVLPADRGPASYCFGRHGRLFEQIGPVVAADAAGACTLVAAALAAAQGRPVIVDAYDGHTAFTSWLRDCGFRGERPLFRMRRPPAAGSGPEDDTPRRVLTEFAVFGPEFA